MATYKLRHDTFTKIAESTGTIQNNSQWVDIEVASDQTVGSGIILHPGQRVSFGDATIYARAMQETATPVEALTVSFIAGSGGGGGGGGTDGDADGGDIDDGEGDSGGLDGGDIDDP